MPDDRTNTQDPGQIEVVSEQRPDGTFEIKVQTRETPAIDPPETVATGETTPVSEGNGAVMLGFGVVIALLVVGSWFLFVSPRAGDEDQPLVAPDEVPNQTQPASGLVTEPDTRLHYQPTVPLESVTHMQLNPVVTPEPDTGLDATTAQVAAPEEQATEPQPPEEAPAPEVEEEEQSEPIRPQQNLERLQPVNRATITAPNRMVRSPHSIGPNNPPPPIEVQRPTDDEEEEYDEYDEEYDEEYDDEEYDDEEYDDEYDDEYDEEDDDEYDEEYDDEEYDDEYDDEYE